MCYFDLIFMLLFAVQNCVQEDCAHKECDGDPEPHRLSKRDRLQAEHEPQQSAAHHTGGW